MAAYHKVFLTQGKNVRKRFLAEETFKQSPEGYRTKLVRCRWAIIKKPRALDVVNLGAGHQDSALERSETLS